MGSLWSSDVVYLVLSSGNIHLVSLTIVISNIDVPNACIDSHQWREKMDLNQKPHDMGPPLTSNLSNLIVLEATTMATGATVDE